MNVTRDVIQDLWPAYASGEATADTKALVEEFLTNDPEFGAALRENADILAAAPAAPAPAPDLERRTLSMTKRLLRLRTLFLALAILFMTIPPAITTAHLHFEQWGLTSSFTRLPAWENLLALVCLAVSAIFWLAWLALRRRLSVQGF
ncbi:MAG TPA: hypothetical protein VKH43_08140 [Thermoanaerobaculia bacterium]|nr:hypothetical protein [Thermoanaerobaculia bacterium]